MKPAGESLSWLFCAQRLIELAFVMLLAFVLSRRRILRMYRFESALGKLAKSEWSFVAWGLFTFVFSCCLMLVLWMPQPGVHDEFSYLLQADTFSHGRLSNPPHPLWKYFETFHVIQQPTYASKYPPGQGLFLALGQIICHPIVGVWLSTALASTAVFWMLSGIFSRGLALAGAVLTLLNPQVLVWNWSYWGGSVALLGGALALGGACRLMRSADVKPSAIMGFGFAILCLSRPYEGLILSALLGLLLLGIFMAKSWGWNTWLRKFLLPVVCVVAPVLVFQGYYNSQVTGDWRKMPYMTYEESYSRTPLFIWQAEQHSHPIAYNNPQMARFYAEWVEPMYTAQKKLDGFVKTVISKLEDFSGLVWDGTIAICLIPAIWAWRKNSAVRWSIIFLIIAAGLSFVGPVWAQPHYAAPFFPLLMFLAVCGLREIRGWVFGKRRYGLWVSRLLVAYLCASSLCTFLAKEVDAQASHKAWQFGRATLEATLESDECKHLVLVRYPPDHDFHQEWVWNSADVDSARVIWALDKGDANNGPLLDYFKGRKMTVLVAKNGSWHATRADSSRHLRN